MFTSRWVIAVAIGLACGLVPKDSLGQVTTEDQPRQMKSRPTGEDGSQDQHPEPIDFTPALEGIEAAIRELIAAEDKIDREQAQDRENRDLEAQEGMAKWAEYMFYATAGTVLLTFFALIAIVRTLHHTRRAADYASDMVHEAAATTIAAQETVDVTKKIGRQQNSAYVSVSSANMCFTTEAEKDAVAWVTFHNSGHTPAENFDYSVDVKLTATDGSSCDLALSHHAFAKYVTAIPPGQNHGKKSFLRSATVPDTIWTELCSRTPHAGRVKANVVVRYGFDTLGTREFREVELMGEARFLHDNDSFPLNVASNIRNLKLIEQGQDEQ